MDNLGLKISSRIYRLTKVLKEAGVTYDISEDGNTVILPLQENLTVVIGDNRIPDNYDPFCYTGVCLAESKDSVVENYQAYAESKPISLRLATWACRERSTETGTNEVGLSKYNHTLYEVKKAITQYLHPSCEILN